MKTVCIGPLKRLRSKHTSMDIYLQILPELVYLGIEKSSVGNLKSYEKNESVG